MNDAKEVVFSERIIKHFGIEKLNSQMFIDKFTKVNYYKGTTKESQKGLKKEDDMRTNYMMTVDDVMEELGVKRSKAYSILHFQAL